LARRVSVPVWLRKALSDQFVWFLVLGASLFALHAYFNDPARQIRLGEADVTMLASRWEAQTGSTPTPEEVNSLVEYHVREEILAREAMRLGLDAGDAIVRRRLVQKMELLIRDRYEPPARRFRHAGRPDPTQHAQAEESLRRPAQAAKIGLSGAQPPVGRIAADGAEASCPLPTSCPRLHSNKVEITSCAAAADGMKG